MTTRSASAPDVADFLHHIEKNRQYAVVDESPTSRRAFVPITALRSYLTCENISKLLRSYHLPHHNWKTIQQDYIIIFTILISIGKVPYLQYFLEGRSDAHLPFRPSEAEDWHFECRKFFTEFSDAQWQFCAQNLEPNRLNGRRIDDKVILPFTKQRRIKHGKDVYEVEAHPAYNQLVGKGEESNVKTHSFVLKSCREREAEYHHNEVEAYSVLSEQEDVLPYLARFYGSWKHGDRYYMLLEFVDGGTLADFFARTGMPSQEEDIMNFWESLSKVVKPLARIHKLPITDSGHPGLQGIHHDIKPDNILVSKSKGTSEFDVTFKLADLGLTNLDLVPQNLRDLGGTQMFSAPEYCFGEADLFILRTVRDAKPSKDIWALGCVFSAAAVWSVLGSHGLSQYLANRKAATDEIPKLRQTAYSGCFHDGSNVLQAVFDMHVRVLKERRTNDFIIQEIVPLVERMLKSSESRPTAMDVYQAFQDAIKRAKALSDRASIWVPSVLRTEPDPVVTRLPPRELPTGLGVQLNLLDVDTSTVAGVQTGEDSPKSFTQDEDCEKHMALGSTHSQISPAHNRTSFGQQFYDGSPNVHQRPRPVSHAVQYGNSPGNAGLVHSSALPLHIRLPDGSEPDISSMMGQRGTRDLEPSNVPQGKRVEREELPLLTMNDAAHWVSQKERKRDPPPLPGHEYFKILDGRDQIFLIDDSKTMQTHWPHVKRAFRTLGYLVKGFDRDGIEIRFSVSLATEGRSKNRKKLIAILDSVRPGGQCNMALALGKVLQKYTSEDRNERSLKIFSRSKSKWGLSLYVLTDGIWEDDEQLKDVAKAVKSLVDKLDARDMPRGNVGIQFIQFGNDPVGTKRLKFLDDELTSLGVSTDIIDTEPYDGNVYKILLGSIDAQWDKYSPKTPTMPSTSRPPVPTNRHSALI